MSMDKSLKSRAELRRHRNVLTRAERVEALEEAERWQTGRDVFGLPKVAHRKVQTRKKLPAVAKAAAEGAAAAPEGAAAAPAPGAAAPREAARKEAPKAPARKERSKS